MLFALTSAKTRKGVAQAFDEVARCVYDEISANVVDEEWDDNSASSQMKRSQQPQWSRSRRLDANEEEHGNRLCC